MTAWLLSPPSKQVPALELCVCCLCVCVCVYVSTPGTATVQVYNVLVWIELASFFLVFFFNLSRKVCRPVPMRKVLRLHNPQQSKFNLQPELNPRQLETTNQGCWIMCIFYLIYITFTIYLNITIIFITIQKIKKEESHKV